MMGPRDRQTSRGTVYIVEKPWEAWIDPEERRAFAGGAHLRSLDRENARVPRADVI